MLKKSLHFLKRFIFLCLFLSIISFPCSCEIQRENYLSFLDVPSEYDASLVINEETAATFILTIQGKDEAGNSVVHLRFTSPQVLYGAEILCVGEERTLTYNGISLEGHTLPHVWNKILDLFSPKGEISKVKVKNGNDVITVTDSEKGWRAVYITTKDGCLSRIESDIAIEIHSIRNRKKGVDE